MSYMATIYNKLNEPVARQFKYISTQPRVKIERVVCRSNETMDITKLQSEIIVALEVS